MPAPILATKLYIPPARPNAVLRPRLFERLNEGLLSGRKLALVSTPAVIPYGAIMALSLLRKANLQPGQ